MAESTQSPSSRPKRNRRFRLVVLLITLALALAVYLPLRTSRANDLLTTSLMSSDIEGVRYALNNGADPDLLLRPAVADHFGSLLDFVRMLFHRSLRPASNNAKTALMYAVNSGETESVTELLQHGANVNIRLAGGYSALLYAASKKSSDVLEALLAKGADIHVQNQGGETPLLFAAQAGQTQNVRLLLAKGENVHETDRHLQTALTLAVENRREQAVQVLLTQGADARDLKGARFPSNSARFYTTAPGRSLVTVNGVTTVILSGPGPRPTPQTLPAMPPLTYAAAYGSPALLKFLWERTDANIKREYGWAILCNGVQSDNSEVVRFLLDHNLPVSLPDTPVLSAERSPTTFRKGYEPSKVYTPLHYASALPDPQIARLLIARGAAVNAEDMFGTTPLLAAVSGAHTATIRLLIEHGANVRATERNSGQNALMRGVQDVEITRLLLDHGLDVNARDHTGRTALMQCYSPQVAALLVERGADVNARDAQGNTALLTAVRSYQKDHITLLLKHGANVNSINSQGETPLSVARTMRLAPLITLLTAAGAKR